MRSRTCKLVAIVELEAAVEAAVVAIVVVVVVVVVAVAFHFIQTLVRVVPHLGGHRANDG